MRTARTHLRLRIPAATIAGLICLTPVASTAVAHADPTDSQLVTRSGTVQHIIADPAPGTRKPGADITMLDVAGVLVAAPEDARTLPTGAHVAVTVRMPPTGEQSLRSALRTRQATVVSATATSTTSSADSGSEIGTHHVTIVPVLWGPESSQGTRPTDADFAAAVSSVDSYYNTVTGGKIRFTLSAVRPWLNLASSPSATSGCDDAAIHDAVIKSLGTTDIGTLGHVVAYYPGDSGCTWAGLGEEPGSFVWLNGYTDLSVMGHELGHNLGLDHSGGLVCYSDATLTTQVTLSDACGQEAYLDPWDLMGNSPFDHVGYMSIAHLDQLGVLPAGSTEMIGKPVTVHLAPVESGTGLRGITIPLGRRICYAEYRTATGLDSWINDGSWDNDDGTTTAQPGGGLIVRCRWLIDGWNTDEQDALNFHPARGDGWPSGLAAGESWSSADGHLGFRVDSADNDGANVTITVPEDTTPPKTAVLDSPTPGEIVTDRTTAVVWHNIGDVGNGVAKGEIEIDGTVSATLDPEELDLGWDELRLPEGRHTVRLLIYDTAGNVTASKSVSFIVDFHKPVFTAPPTAALRTGSVSAHALPVVVKWGVTDLASGLEAQALDRKPASRSVFLGPNPRSANVYAALGQQNYWMADATDNAGFPQDSKGPSTLPLLATLNTRSSAFTGHWVTVRSTQALGGSEQVTKTAGARFTRTVTARSVGLVANTGPTRGKFTVLVDGTAVATVDLYSKTTTLHRLVWAHTWPAAGKHTITVTNQATPGRPSVGLDAFATLS